MTNKILRPAVWACGSVWRSTALLLVVICIALPLMHTQMSWTSDDGAYHLQVEALRAGSWATPDPAAAIDPTGSSFPYANSISNDGRWYTAVPRPLWPVMLQAGQAVGGDQYGFLIPCVLGALATCAMCWLIGERLRPGSGKYAFWLAALSPVLFNTFVPWAHTVATAFAALGIWLILRPLQSGRVRLLDVSLAGAAFGVGCLFRTETLLIAVACLGVVFVLALVRKSWVDAAKCAVGGAMALLFAAGNELWRYSIVGQGATALPSSPSNSEFVASRIHAVQTSLFRASGLNQSLGRVCLLVLLGACAAVFFARRYRPRWAGVIVPLALLAVMATFIVRLVIEPDDWTNGLFAAYPVALVGLFALSPAADRIKFTTRTYLALAAVAFVIMAIPTLVEEGGGIEWGGRYFSPILPILVVLLATSESLRWIANLNRVSYACLAGLLVVPIATGLTSSAHSRRHTDFNVQLESLPSEYILTTVEHAGRIFWRAAQHKKFIYLDPDKPNEAATLQARLAKAYEVSGQPVAVLQEGGDELVPQTCLFITHANTNRQLGVGLYPASSC